ncbi:MAG TPA: hypothetical protein VK427_24550 [Kofleriaceae bacterium]|nr:hypothetical protein [Kofleriaceae bacterium]
MTTRVGGLAMHVADRHLERWAPEATANQSRPLRNLSFVDRTIAPWIETAQRSASLRMFSQYRAEGIGERQTSNVSWVFPRPWYQDELDWMAAARQAPVERAAPGAAPASSSMMLTTRGTYVPTTQAQQHPAALPAALYELIAPSLSIAQPTTQARGIGYGGNDAVSGAYSPLVPLAAVQAAEVMQRAVAPTIGMQTPGSRMQPALRNVLSAMLERAAVSSVSEPSRVSMHAPALVTPPAPRADEARLEPSDAMQLAERYAEQRSQIAEVQRLTRVAAEREMATRIEAARAQVAPDVRDAPVRAHGSDAARADAVRVATERLEAARAVVENGRTGVDAARIEEAQA